MGTTGPLLCTVLLGAGLLGCASGESSDRSPGITSGSSNPAAGTTPDGATTTPTPSTTESAPATLDAANTTLSPSTTPLPATTVASTTSQPAAPTTTVMYADGFEPPPADRVTLSVDVPTGEFLAAPGDLVVLRTNGDLEYRPNALSPGNQAPPIVLVDRADPRPGPQEGLGPNLVSDVAAFVDGSVLYGECCEPVSGNVFAVDAPRSDVGPIAVGNLTDQSPDGSRLATASNIQFSIIDVESGDGHGLVLQPTPDQRFSIVDIEWADDDTLMAIIFDGRDHRVVPYDADTMIASPIQRNLDPNVDYEAVRFVGRSPQRHVVVATTTGFSTWDVLYLNPSTFAENNQLHQNFPLSVSNLEIDAGGLGQIWVDGGTLYYLGPGQFEARPIGDGIISAWFVESS